MRSPATRVRRWQSRRRPPLPPLSLNAVEPHGGFPTRDDATFRTRVVDRIVVVVHYGAAILADAST